MINSTSKFSKKSTLVTIVIAGTISLVIFLNKDSKPVSYMQGIVQSIFSHPKSILYAIGKDEKSLTPLEKKVRELELKLVNYELTIQDNIALKSQFETSGETTQSLIAAKIVGFQGNNKSPHEFVINTGKRHGIKKGMTVVFKNYFIGKVDLVSNNFSVVITPYNPKLRVLAKYPKTNANGIVVGQRDFVLFDGVVITDQLDTDGIIVTKGEVDRTGTGIVPDLIIGKIHSISKNETAPFQSAEIMPLLQYSSLRSVFIIAQM